MSLTPRQHLPHYRLLAIDPGSTKCGVAIVDCDPARYKINSIRAWTLSLESMPNDTGLMAEFHDNFLIRLYKLRKACERILQSEQPMYVAYERPFINPTRPNAYGPLMAVHTMLRDASLSYHPTMPFHILSPGTVKKFIGVKNEKGKSSKDLVLEAAKRNPSFLGLLEAGGATIDLLDDNGLDAALVGYTAVCDYIFKELQLCEIFHIPR